MTNTTSADSVGDIPRPDVLHHMICMQPSFAMFDYSCSTQYVCLNKKFTKHCCWESNRTGYWVKKHENENICLGPNSLTNYCHITMHVILGPCLHINHRDHGNTCRQNGQSRKDRVVSITWLSNKSMINNRGDKNLT